MSTLVIDAGIDFAFDESRFVGDGVREFNVLLGADNSRSARSSALSCRTAFLELGIVARVGLAGRSLLAFSAGRGRCSMESLELIADGEIAIGGGFRFFFFITVPDDSDEDFPSLSCRWPRSLVELGPFGFKVGREDWARISGNEDVSPLCNFASINLSVTCRPSGVPSPPFLLLPPLSARLLFTLSFPSITFAEGGGCNIHLVSSLLAGCVLTTGGCRSFTGGFLPK